MGLRAAAEPVVRTWVGMPREGSLRCASSRVLRSLGIGNRARVGHPSALAPRAEARLVLEAASLRNTLDRSHDRGCVIRTRWQPERSSVGDTSVIS